VLRAALVQAESILYGVKMKTNLLAILLLSALTAPFAQAYESQYDCHAAKKNIYLRDSFVVETDGKNDSSIWIDNHAFKVIAQDRNLTHRGYLKRYRGNTRFLKSQVPPNSKFEILFSNLATPIKRYLVVRVHRGSTSDPMHSDDTTYFGANIQDEAFVCIDVQAGT